MLQDGLIGGRIDEMRRLINVDYVGHREVKREQMHEIVELLNVKIEKNEGMCKRLDELSKREEEEKKELMKVIDRVKDRTIGFGERRFESVQYRDEMNRIQKRGKFM
ncbi:hypothetical protein O9G_005645 [Rozella allomycis CSF55]|uniref:Uncharacterized protein n=1 Tax=Rozella allomycis (strain CSF55) TaxID=988480 RepID=A0A075ASU0_ROZAC|nr:hypothetical protein O9G_005645 [Rozella allomycis CSF55]|eukprot:EPZ33230.1 hypothetical protein O9G_005645 [Rozella allomycis CSF55]